MTNPPTLRISTKGFLVFFPWPRAITQRPNTRAPLSHFRSVGLGLEKKIARELLSLWHDEYPTIGHEGARMLGCGSERKVLSCSLQSSVESIPPQALSTPSFSLVWSTQTAFLPALPLLCFLHRPFLFLVSVPRAFTTLPVSTAHVHAQSQAFSRLKC